MQLTDMHINDENKNLKWHIHFSTQVNYEDNISKSSENKMNGTSNPDIFRQILIDAYKITNIET